MKIIGIRKYFVAFSLLMLFVMNASVSGQGGEASFRVAFYNAENFFDTRDDTLTRDDDYTPGGPRAWTEWKYRQKRNNIYKVLAAVGAWEGVDIIGLAEIENRTVLDDLVSATPLSMHDYGIVHRDSPDRRGIDVALLYKRSRVQIIHERFIEITFPFDSTQTTRDILYTALTCTGKDTLHVFVNHWPSRWGGEENSRPNRIAAAKTLRMAVDSVLTAYTNPGILIMGDFNDTPLNKSITHVLHAHDVLNTKEDTALYNLTMQWSDLSIGTYKYQGNWSILDQIMVTGNLLNKSKPIYTTTQSVSIFKEDFLFVEDERYTGKTPYRSYHGYDWQPGFSDHLPVFIDLYAR